MLIRLTHLSSRAKPLWKRTWERSVCLKPELSQDARRRMEFTLTRLPLSQAHGLSPLAYLDHDYMTYEKDIIFKHNWFGVGHVQELSSVGSVKVVDVGGNSYLLTCDRHLKIRAFFNTCRHRGAKVTSRNMTNCKQLVCPYHLWTYGLDGHLKATPPEALPPSGIKKADLGLTEVPVHIFAGIIFIFPKPKYDESKNLTDTPDFLSLLGDLPQKLERFDFDDLEIFKTRPFSIASDWKVIPENFIDFYHVDGVHPALAKFSRVIDHLPYQGPGRYVGFVTYPLTSSGGPGDMANFNMEGSRISPNERMAALFFQIFPNVSLTIYPHSVYTLICLPSTKDGLTNEQMTVLVSPKRRLESDSPEMFQQKAEELYKFIEWINMEDVSAIENVQLGFTNMLHTQIPGTFSPKYDWPIYRFQSILLDVVDGNEDFIPGSLEQMHSPEELKLIYNQGKVFEP